VAYFARKAERFMAVINTDLNEQNTITPADWVRGPQQGDWTYEAYAALTDDGECYEIVQGVLVMSPSPEDIHQDASALLNMYLCQEIRVKKLGIVFSAPFDVMLSPRNVFQPDLLVVLNEHLDRIQERGLMGAPDLVVEVVLPSSKLYDRLNKHMAYEQAGIPEYWLVDPRAQSIEVFALEGEKYHSLGIFKGEQALPSRIVPQMTTPVGHFFV
jgi:Uma2 family endonuclease